MSLDDLSVQKEYRNMNCDISRDFYIPALNEAVVYKRADGYFNSSALAEISAGIKGLINNGGSMQLIVSPNLSMDDINSIREGYRRREDVIADSLLRDISVMTSAKDKRRLNLLANLIADRVLDIKVAFKVSGDSAGIYHEKIGIIKDLSGNSIAFTGSMNETYSGLSKNYESIDVYCSWKQEDYERTCMKENDFDRLWNNMENSLEIIEFPQVAVERLKAFQTKSTPEIINEEQEEAKAEENGTFFRLPEWFTPHDYQQKAIDTWIDKKGRGIFDMATGTGKTYTALGALAALSRLKKDKLAVFIVCPYQHLVEQWLPDIREFGVNPLVCYSAYKWEKMLEDIVYDYEYDIIDNFCVITTNATFALKRMQDLVNRIHRDCCLVVDEAHNFGSKKQLECMTDIFNYRMALSATIDRHHDEAGTQKLFDYFGDKCIEYTLKQAIDAGYLTPYKYYPVPVSFEEDELREYVELTDKVAKILRGTPEGEDIPQSAQTLLIKRARIIAGAHGKTEALKEVIKEHINENNMLVYCGATKVLGEYLKDPDIDESEQRQIDEITSMLGNDLHMKVTQFTSREDHAQREVIKEAFARGDIQALVAIKCLDEGMNIPGIRTAFILASSTNPKEYIQRRGRVLRKAEGKDRAEIYDFVVLPRPLDEHSPGTTINAEISLVNRELERMKEFQELSLNPSSVTEIIKAVTEKYNLYTLRDGYDRI